MQETGSNCLEQAQDTRLSIQIDLSGLSFMKESDKVATMHPYALATSDYDIQLDNLEQAFTTISDLNVPYKEVNVLYNTHKFTLIPSDLFELDKANALLKQVHQIDDLDEMGFYEFKNMDFVCVYALPALLTSKIVHYQRESKFVASVVAIMSELYLLDGHSKAMLYFSSAFIYLSIIQDGKMLLTNAYDCKEPVTALYFLLLALKQWQINPQQLSLYVAGRQLTDSQYKQIRKYCPNMQVIDETTFLKNAYVF